jgi:hypothetical protein
MWTDYSALCPIRQCVLLAIIFSINITRATLRRNVAVTDGEGCITRMCNLWLQYEFSICFRTGGNQGKLGSSWPNPDISPCLLCCLLSKRKQIDLAKLESCVSNIWWTDNSQRTPTYSKKISLVAFSTAYLKLTGGRARSFYVRTWRPAAWAAASNSNYS